MLIPILLCRSGDKLIFVINRYTLKTLNNFIEMVCIQHFISVFNNIMDLVHSFGIIVHNRNTFYLNIKYKMI